MELKTFACFSLLLILFSCKKEAGPKGAPGDQGDPGIDGYTSLIKITPFASNASCINGGVTIQSGIDKNKNNILDSSEIDNSEDVCNGANAESDKQIFFTLSSSNSNTTTPVITRSLLKFNKTYYPGVDSIIFVAEPYVSDPSNNCILELYNITDQQVIPGSTLTSNVLVPGTFIQTGNIYNNLPDDKEITLGLSQRSSKEGFYSYTGSCYLFLYRK
jgi:hypothetical protein